MPLLQWGVPKSVLVHPSSRFSSRRNDDGFFRGEGERGWVQDLGSKNRIVVNEMTKGMSQSFTLLWKRQTESKQFGQHYNHLFDQVPRMTANYNVLLDKALLGLTTSIENIQDCSKGFIATWGLAISQVAKAKGDLYTQFCLTLVEKPCPYMQAHNFVLRNQIESEHAVHYP